jgi:hypothetical protein
VSYRHGGGQPVWPPAPTAVPRATPSRPETLAWTVEAVVLRRDSYDMHNNGLRWMCCPPSRSTEAINPMARARAIENLRTVRGSAAWSGDHRGIVGVDDLVGGGVS